MIGTTILHEGGHATATCCAPAGEIRHIMLNPCCGGHAYAGHQGGEIWEAWVAFAGPMWDIIVAYVVYYVQVSTQKDGKARSAFIAPVLGTVGYNVTPLMPQLQKMWRHDANAWFKSGKHFLDDRDVFWMVVAAFVMDWQFISFAFNMLPIITLDGADLGQLGPTVLDTHDIRYLHNHNLRDSVGRNGMGSTHRTRHQYPWALGLHQGPA